MQNKGCCDIPSLYTSVVHLQRMISLTNRDLVSLGSVSQRAGHVPLSDPADEGEAQAGIWDCEGADRDHSAVFSHRGGAAVWPARGADESLWDQDPQGKAHLIHKIMLSALQNVV